MDERRRKWSILQADKQIWLACSTEQGYPPEWFGPMTARDAIHRLGTAIGPVLAANKGTRTRPGFVQGRLINQGELLRLAAFEAGEEAGRATKERHDASAG